MEVLASEEVVAVLVAEKVVAVLVAEQVVEVLMPKQVVMVAVVIVRQMEQVASQLVTLSDLEVLRRVAIGITLCH